MKGESVVAVSDFRINESPLNNDKRAFGRRQRS